jgi:hypothetical protein
MAEWMIDEFRSALSVVAQIWNDTPAPIKTIVVAAFGTLVGAFLTSRSQAKRRIIEELRAIHAAYTMCLATVNKALAAISHRCGHIGAPESAKVVVAQRL